METSWHVDDGNDRGVLDLSRNGLTDGFRVFATLYRAEDYHGEPAIEIYIEILNDACFRFEFTLTPEETEGLVTLLTDGLKKLRQGKVVPLR